MDRLVSALFHSAGDNMIQVEMAFSHRLDPRRLKKAMALATDAEPILGCRFVYHRNRPYWQRLPMGSCLNFQALEDEDFDVN